MDHNNKTNISAFSFPGGSSLTVIFAVLCLTVFALLSLNTAQAGTRLSERSAEAVAAYYRADRQAEEILARLRAGEHPDGVTFDGRIVSYVCPISETQELRVTIERNGTGTYTVLQWQSVSTAAWQPEEAPDVWDGIG